MTTTRKLGLLPTIPSKPRLRLSAHLDTAAALAVAAPTKVDYLSEVPVWDIYRNDEVGDCGPASVAHFLTAAGTYGDQSPFTSTVEQVIDLYSRISGYDPATGANDNGVVMQDMLNEVRKNGIGGQKILGFAEVDLSKPDEVRAALHVFGGLLIGANLPIAAEKQFDKGAAWDVVSGRTGVAGSWGGHAVHVGAYDHTAATLRCTTWGVVQPMTEAWFTRYVGEAWVALTPELLRADGTVPAGLNLFALGEEFSALTGEVNPFPAPAPTPTPTPEPEPEPDPATGEHGDDEALIAAFEQWKTTRGL